MTTDLIATATALPDEQAAPNATPDFSGMAPYRPVSRASALETFVPQSMAYETRQALLRTQALVGGDVDKYVAEKLRYSDVAALHSFFSAEQVDALALAIFNIETGEGMVIGDQTGIGKGRIAAGVIRYGCMNGRPTIFVTEKPTLFSDLYRDLYDIGSLDLVPLIINTDPTATLQINLDAETIVKVHEHMGNDNYKPKTLQQLRVLLHDYVGDDLPALYESGIEDTTTLPPGYNFLMATYSQMSDDIVAKRMMKAQGVAVKIPEKPSASQFKTSFIANYARGAVVILDEAHNASGGESATGFFIRYGILERCAGCCYLSATFAKRPDNMGVYSAKTAIKHAGLTAIKLEEAFAKGGVALQEIIASQLVASGQMLRRQRSFEGIQVEYNYLTGRYEEHAATYDKVIRIVDAIIGFEREYVGPYLKEMAKSLGFGGDKTEKTKGTKEGGINNSPFFNKTHHVIRQLLFSIKAQDVAREAVKMLNQNEKVVIAFSSTMEAFVDDLGLTNGQEVRNADFGLVLQKSLDNALKYTVSSGNPLNGDYQATHYTLSEDDFDSIGADILRGLKTEIANISTGIMLSPIDTLINEIEQHRKPAGIGGGQHEYWRVRECTGRKGQMKWEDGRLVYRSFKANVKQYFAEFNSGEADVLLINQSASTGVSAHSSAKVKDQRPRAMIIHQPELDISTEVQKRGRINRTGQVNKPRYLYVSSSIPAEKRIFMVLKRKLKSLDANTTGNQRSSQQVLETEDFFNRYGDKVVTDFLAENLAIASALDMGSSGDDDDQKRSAGNDVAETFSRRIALLPVSEQERAYADVIERYSELIRDLKERGEYDLEVEYLDLQAETQERTILAMGSGKPSAFGRHAVLETVSAKVLRRPMKFSEVKALAEQSLAGRTPEVVQQQALLDYQAGRAELMEARTARLNRDIEAVRQKLAAPTKGDEGEGALDKLNERLNRLREELATLRAKIQAETNNGERMIRYFKIGKTIKFKRGEREYMGFVVNLYFAKPEGDSARFTHANIRVALAVYGPERTATLKFNDNDTVAAMQHTDSTPRQYLDDLLYNWNRLEVKDDKREVRQIVANNVLLGIAKTEKGKLVKFSAQNGAIRSGILLENERKPGEAAAKPKTQRPITYLKEEIMLSRPGERKFFVGGTDVKNSLAFERRYDGTVQVTMPSTGQFKRFWSDQDLIDLLAPFYNGAERKFRTWYGNIFEGYVSNENLPAFLQILWDKHQLHYDGAPIAYNEADDAPLPDDVIEVEVVATRRQATDMTENDIVDAQMRQMLEMLNLELQFEAA